MLPGVDQSALGLSRAVSMWPTPIWPIESVDGVLARIGSRTGILFCTDDFLGLTGDPRLIPPIVAALEREGAVLAGPVALGGGRAFHQRFCAQLSLERRCEETLLGVSTRELFAGFVNALLDERDILVLDHACSPLLSALAVTSRVRCAITPHLEFDAVERVLRQNSAARRRVIVVEGFFGASGTCAPLQDLYELATATDSHLVVDESFAIGVFGPTGRGTLEENGLIERGITQLFGFDRSLGAPGAALSSSRAVCSLVREGETYRELAALSAPSIATAEAALAISATESTRRARLRAMAVRTRRELQTMGYRTSGTADAPVIPVALEDAARLTQLINGLYERGILVAPSLHPPQKELTHSIRLTISALHTEEQITQLLQAFEEIGKRIGILKK